MSIIDNTEIWLSDAEITNSAGVSLGSTLYPKPLDIWLHGELGAGKTTFLQGFLKGLGVRDAITSPTYALEQRYETAHHGQILHLDLYRLTKEQARELLLHSADHPGIRCIEWAERLESSLETGIEITLKDAEQGGRTLTMEFTDIPLPSREQIMEWREEFMLPIHIGTHCDVVANVASILGNALSKRGVLFRPLALRRAAEAHDLLRFIDFTGGKSNSEIQDSADALALWQSVRNNYPHLKHEPACAAFLKAQGYSELGDIVEPHGLRLPSPERTTIEQKLLFYADKRVAVDKPVSLEERFQDLAVRYGEGKASEMANVWIEECRLIERELFPDGVPPIS